MMNIQLIVNRLAGNFKAVQFVGGTDTELRFEYEVTEGEYETLFTNTKYAECEDDLFFTGKSVFVGDYDNEFTVEVKTTTYNSNLEEVDVDFDEVKTYKTLRGAVNAAVKLSIAEKASFNGVQVMV